MMQTSDNQGFETYQNFFNETEAQPMVGFLEENDIPYKLEQNKIIVDDFMVGSGVQTDWALRIPAKYFKKVNELLDQFVTQVKEVPSSHYLQQFTNEELQDVVKNADEWTKQDVHFARLLLMQQGSKAELEEAELAAEKKQQTLREGKKGDRFWMNTYLVFSIFGSLLFSPMFFVVGLAMGWYYWKDQTLDANGDKFFTFELGTRSFGRLTFIIGVVVLFLGLLFWATLGISSFSDWFDFFAHHSISPFKEKWEVEWVGYTQIGR